MTVVVLLAVLLFAPSAGAVILPAQTVDGVGGMFGSTAEVVGFGGAAMAEDGTGGIVYLKRVGGVAHVFVARYQEGHWMAPIRVDTEQPYAASWPRIGAAEGGELLVTWATPYATEKGKPVLEMLSSELGPGASTFGPVSDVDTDIGEGTGTNPDLAMSPTGQADLVYRVVETSGPAALTRPGDVNEQVKVAHYDLYRWTDLGTINRDPGIGMRPPTTANAPQVAIGPTGSGVVVWQEPEIANNGVARIYARRIFGQGLNYVMPVSAETYNGAPINEDADAPAVAFSRLGQAEVVYRQNAGNASPLPGPRVFLNVLPDGESEKEKGEEFLGAQVIETTVAGGKSGQVGRPSIDIDENNDVRALFDADGQPHVVEGNSLRLTGTLQLGPPFVGSKLAAADELPAASVMNPEGGGVSAWPSANPQGEYAVAVREDFPSGAVQTGLVSGDAGGPIGELSVGRSGLGDGLVAFEQGETGNASIAASIVSAPPETFVPVLAKVWIKPSQAVVTWAPATSARGPVRYTVVLDGRRLPTPSGTFFYRFNPRGLGDGEHQVQVLATDIDGQTQLTAPFPLKIDGRPPLVSVSRGGSSVTVRIKDAQSGVDTRAVTVSFGDGTYGRSRTLFHHRYRRPGTYKVTVTASDNIGNRGTVRSLVTIP